MSTDSTQSGSTQQSTFDIDLLEPPPPPKMLPFSTPKPSPTPPLPRPVATRRRLPPPKPGWQVLERSNEPCAAFALGDWSAMAGGRLTGADFQPVSPPDLAAGLGLATVYEPQSAGWFLAAGRRLHVKSTGKSRGHTTYSYESLARMGWAVGIARGTSPTARIHYYREPAGPEALEHLLARATREAPDAGAWLLAGQVEFATVCAHALRRCPTPEAPLNAASDPEDPGSSHFRPQTHYAMPALMVALVVDPQSSRPAARALAKRFFAPGAGTNSDGLLWRAHCAPFNAPVPPIDPARPFEAIWDVSARHERFPRVTTVRQVLDGTTVGRVHWSLWALDALEPYDLYGKPEFVDLLELEPAPLADQRWATSGTFVGEPIYERPRLLLRPEPARAIERINRRLGERGLQLKVYDAYRPLSVTQRLYNLRPDKAQQGFLAAPSMGSRHNRGAAVDVTLADAEGNELEMPSEYLCFDSRSHRSWAGMTPTARANMELLTHVMASDGFSTIHEEWWHFDAAEWEKYRVADVPLWPDEGGLFPARYLMASVAAQDETPGSADETPAAETTPFIPAGAFESPTAEGGREGHGPFASGGASSGASPSFTTSTRTGATPPTSGSLGMALPSADFAPGGVGDPSSGPAPSASLAMRQPAIAGAPAGGQTASALSASPEPAGRTSEGSSGDTPGRSTSLFIVLAGMGAAVVVVAWRYAS